MSRFTYYKNAQRFKERIMRLQRAVGVTDDGIIGPITLTAFEDKLLKIDELKSDKVTNDDVATEVEGEIDGVAISKDALDLIVQFETGGKSYYDRFIRRPSWPGYSSGVTIGFGYDLGYNTKTSIERDWSHELSRSDVDRLKNAAGIRGSSASARASSLRDIQIPWETAQRVFFESTLPKYVALTIDRAFPDAEFLHPHALGALVSLVFNRGTSMSGSRRREMLTIRKLIESHDEGDPNLYHAIADQILSMRRLWARKNGKTDLWGRRAAEAELVKKSLTDSNPDVFRV